MRVTLGKTRLYLHPLLPILWGAVILTGQGSRVLPALLTLLIHESGHILAAKCFRQQIEAREITPLGGILTLRVPEALSPAQTLLIAAAGPVFSFLGCFAAPFLYERGILDYVMTGAFLKSSALLFLVNLLPALPLDGGRMAQALCGLLFPNVRPRRFLYCLGAAAGFCLCLITAVFAFQGRLILAPLFAGLYLFYAAGVENRQEPIRYATALIDRRQKISLDQVLPVQIFAAGEAMQAKKLLKNLSPGKYHYLLVLSPDGVQPVGLIDESAYCDAILSGQSQTLGQICQSMPAYRIKQNK